MPGGLYTPIDGYNDQLKLNSDLQSAQSTNLLKAITAQASLRDFGEQNALRSEIKNSIDQNGNIDWGGIQQSFLRHDQPDMAMKISGMIQQRQMLDMAQKMLLGRLSGQAQQTQQSPQWPAMPPLSANDLQTIQGDMAKNPNAPAQLSASPQWGSGYALNDAGVNAGAINPLASQPQQQSGGLYGLPPESIMLNLAAGPEGLTKIAQDLNERTKVTPFNKGAQYGNMDANGNVRVLGFSPEVKEGMTVGPNNVVSNATNYLNALQEQLRAQERVKNENATTPTMDAAGNPGITTQQDVLNNLAQQRAAQTRLPTSGAAGQMPPPIVPPINPGAAGTFPVPAVPNGPNIATQKAQEKQAVDSEASADETVKAAANARVLQAGLTNISGILERLKTGPGTNWKIQAARLLNSVPGINIGKDQISSYDELEKAVIPLVAQQSRVMGSREAAQIVMMIRTAFPNAQMTEDSLSHIIGIMNSMNDYALSKNEALTQWRTDHNQSAAGFDADWSKNVNAGIFMLKYLTPEARNNLATALKKQGNWGNFVNDVKYATSHGYLK